ncbi:MAG: autotransporter outer membrane beta-barrel domain-containing protein [Planctomycetes bacterium]|nr:autotransporter outer membrane beta-barrel domain-containing protein [Planctomycetota bacterium]
MPGTGSVSIDNAFMLVLGNLSIGDFGFPGSILLTATGKLKVEGQAKVGTNGSLNGNGFYVCPFTQYEPGAQISPGLAIAGTVAPTKAINKHSSVDLSADALGTLTIDGDVDLQEGSILRIDIASASEGQFDLLKITGNATVNGTLEVHFLSDFVPGPRQTIPILQVTGQTTGQFTEVNLIGLPEGFAGGRFVNGAFVIDTPPAAATVAPELCGAGICSAGITPLMLLSAIGITTIRMRKHQRHTFTNLR